jgi:hypothetical protein
MQKKFIQLNWGVNIDFKTMAWLIFRSIIISFGFGFFKTNGAGSLKQ